jgi:hypothetical protein
MGIFKEKKERNPANRRKFGSRMLRQNSTRSRIDPIEARSNHAGEGMPFETTQSENCTLAIASVVGGH